MTEHLRDQTIELSDHVTLLRTSGDADGAPVLLIHAIGLDRRMWTAVSELLGRGRLLLAYDLRGHGHAAGAPAPSSLAELAEDGKDLLHALGVSPVHVIGLSFGGAVAQELTLRFPELVSRLSLCATLSQGKPISRTRAADAEREGIGPQIEPTILRWFTPPAFTECPEAVSYARQQLAAMRVADWSAAWRVLADLDTYERLPQIKVCTQIVVGDHDVSTPVAESETIAGRVPDSHLRIIPGGGHMLALEHPAALAACLQSDECDVGIA